MVQPSSVMRRTSSARRRGGRSARCAWTASSSRSGTRRGQRTKVSGWTMARLPTQPLQSRRNRIQKSRSAGRMTGCLRLVFTVRQSSNPFATPKHEGAQVLPPDVSDVGEHANWYDTAVDESVRL